jgi:hypothetical protein
VLDADDDGARARARVAGARAVLLQAADEVIAHARKVARSGADVEHARCGTVAQIREEELGRVSVLFFAVCGLELRGGKIYIYIPCVGQRWSRRGRSIFTVPYSEIHGLYVVCVRGKRTGASLRMHAACPGRSLRGRRCASPGGSKAGRSVSVV